MARLLLWLLSGLLVLALGGWGCGGSDRKAPPTCGGAPGPEAVTLSAPGFPIYVVPEGNPITREGIELGRRLFYDPILSADSSQACATCHVQEFAFSDRGRRFSTGIDSLGLTGDRNTPTIVNPLWGGAFFWDGREVDLEHQAARPVTNPIEMAETWDRAVRKISRHAEYPGLFDLAFPCQPITEALVVAAIAQFERSLISDDSRYDRFLRGEASLSPSELRGYNLFFTEKADCFHCHVNVLFTDGSFRDIGIENPPLEGRYAVTHDDRDLGKFKVPTLRNVAWSAPYMHDGRFATLREVIDHYNAGGRGSPNQSPFVHRGRGLGLSEEQKQDLENFILTLSDSSFVTNPEFASPF